MKGFIHPQAAAQPTLFTTLAEQRCPVYRISLVREAMLPVHYGRASSPADVALLLRPLFHGAARERAVVALFDAAMQMIGASVISTGGLTSAIVEPRAVFELALMTNAASVVVAHNHPSGNPEPSKEDVAITKRLVEAGRALAIPVHDHLILTERGYSSLAERGLL